MAKKDYARHGEVNSVCKYCWFILTFGKGRGKKRKLEVVEGEDVHIEREQPEEALNQESGNEVGGKRKKAKLAESFKIASWRTEEADLYAMPSCCSNTADSFHRNHDLIIR